MRRRIQPNRERSPEAGSRLPAHPNRRGLAPLEFVLSLPLLLFVMGLMIIIGTAGAWKARTHAMAREALWRDLAPRQGHPAYNSPGWPDSADVGSSPVATRLIPEDPFSHHEVVRGPILRDPQSGRSLPVDRDALPINQGERMGWAVLERGFPVMGNFPPHGFRFAREPLVLDSTQWRFWEMSLSGNRQHRIPVLYKMDLAAIAPDLTQNYTRRARQVVSAYRSPALDVLDRDEKLNEYYRRYFDFHPRVPSGVCEYDPDFLRSQIVEPLAERIEGANGASGSVPETMATTFLDMYAEIKAKIENPSTPADEKQWLLRFAPDYQQKIDELQDFLQSLP